MDAMFLTLSGLQIFVKPNVFASLILRSEATTFRTSPVRPTSPKYAVPLGIAFPLYEDIIADTAPNRSSLRRRALQFHYHQTGLRWLGLEDHRRHYQDEAGAYAGCTVQSVPAAPGKAFVYTGGRQRPIVDVPGSWD